MRAWIVLGVVCLLNISGLGQSTIYKLDGTEQTCRKLKEIRNGLLECDGVALGVNELSFIIDEQGSIEIPNKPPQIQDPEPGQFLRSPRKLSDPHASIYHLDGTISKGKIISSESRNLTIDVIGFQGSRQEQVFNRRSIAMIVREDGSHEVVEQDAPTLWRSLAKAQYWEFILKEPEIPEDNKPFPIYELPIDTTSLSFDLKLFYKAEKDKIIESELKQARALQDLGDIQSAKLHARNVWLLDPQNQEATSILEK